MGGAAKQAFEFLGKMGAAAVQEATPGQVPVTKSFTSTVKISHDRLIEAVEGGAVPDYMRLPVDQYAIYDSRLMRRVPVTEGDDDIFELSLPTVRPQPGVSRQSHRNR